MRALLAENARLASELNALRAQDGESNIPSVGSTQVTEAMMRLMEVESEDMGRHGDKLFVA